MLKSGKKEHEHRNLKEVPVKEKNKVKREKLEKVRERESYRDMLTEDTLDEED